MQAEEPRRTFLTLDGLRGIGAFLVVTRHVPFLFGPFRAPESFLAVDLFYLVSGFVVAHAYRVRLENGGFFGGFVKTRLIRLYPMYLCGLAFGLLAAVLSFITDPAGWWTWEKLAYAVVTGLFMIPMVPGLVTNGSALDGPIWTLLPELIANFTYAFFIRFLNLWVMCAIIAVRGLGVVLAEFHYDSLDVGFGPTQQWAALARVFFSFFSGVVLFRLFGHVQKHVEWASWACMAALTLLLIYQPNDDIKPWFELGAVMIGFPMLLVLAGCFEPSDRTGKIFSHIGLMSYGVYLLHQPVGNLVRIIIGRNTPVPTGPVVLIFGVAFLVGVTLLAGWLDKHYDGPVRKILRQRFMSDGAKKAA